MLNKDLKPAATYTRVIDIPELKGAIQIDAYNQPFLSTQSQDFYTRVFIFDEKGEEWGHGIYQYQVEDGEKELDKVIANINLHKNKKDTLTARLNRDEISG
jgi:hypothetical protein